MKNKKILYFSLFILVLFGVTSVVFASVTISNTGITGNTSFNSIGGNLADTIIDVGTGKILSLQTVNNGPVNLGSGLLTITNLAGSGIKCLHVSNTGVVSVAAADCGSGGGGTPGGSDGQVQVNSGGTSFVGQSSIFSSGTKVQRAVECASGTVGTAQLSGLSAGTSGEVTIQTGISGDVRWQGVILSETTQFTGTGLTVSMGRPGSTTHAEMTNGVNFPLGVSSSDVNYLSTRPIPPQITDTYSIALNFIVSSGNVNASTGSLTWEICGYKAR